MVFGSRNPTPFARIGTTSPIYVPRSADAKQVQPGEYFWIKVQSSQAVFRGNIFVQAEQLIVTSKVNLNHPLLGNEEIFAIQRTREIKKNQAEQLGLSPNLISLVPATMPKVSLTIDFLVDSQNNLAKLGDLINGDSLLAVVSLAPGAAAVAKTVGSLAQKIIQSFVPAQSRQPILTFAGNFNIGGEDTSTGLRDGYYVILGTRSDQDPLPDPLPQLEVRDDGLRADGKPVTQLSYIVLDVTRLPVRTRELSEGAAWDGKLREAERMAREVSEDPFSDDSQKRDVWNKCKALLQEARGVLLADSNYAPNEADLIYQVAYKKTADLISGKTTEAGGEAKAPGEGLDTKAERSFMAIPSDADLTALVNQYESASQETSRILQANQPV